MRAEEERNRIGYGWVDTPVRVSTSQTIHQYLNDCWRKLDGWQVIKIDGVRRG